MKHKDPHKLKSTALLVFCMLFSLHAFSQHFDWVKSYSGQESPGYKWNNIISSVTDSQGNLYVAGRFANGAAIDGQDLLPITPHGSQHDNRNGIIIKFSPQGQILWKKVIHANDGMPGEISEMLIVGDTALYVASSVYIPHSDGQYIYFYDTLITKDNASYMMPLDSSAFSVATAFSIMDLDGNFLEHHFLQIAWIDSAGRVITLDRLNGNPESSRCIVNQALSANPFCVDSDGNIYIGQVPTDIISIPDIPGSTNRQWSSIENGKLSGVLIMVDGHSRFSFYPENRPSVSNYRILKFSPHFDNLIQYQYVFADTPFWDDDVPTAGRLLMDSDNNIYLCNTVVNDIRMGSGSVSLNGASDMAFEGKEGNMGFLIKYNSHLEPQYIRQIDYQNTSTHGNSDYYYFHNMAIDEDSNSLFVIASVANDVPTDSMFVEGVQLDANNNALFLRFDKNTGCYLSHGIVPSNKFSTFYTTIPPTSVVCKYNRLFAVPAFQNNIQWQNNEINIEQYKWGKGLFIWDYAGNPIQYKDFNSISRQSEPGNALVLHDSILYVCGYSTSSMTMADTTLNPSGNTLAYIAKYVDTSFRTPYLTPHHEPIGINDFITDNPIVYPNPTNSTISIALSEDETIVNCYVISVNGVRCQERLSANILNLSKYPKGIYYLEIITTKNIYKNKIIKT